MARITILTAVFNGDMYFRETIDSVLEQTFEDFEFLIIDDGSTDGSRDIVRSYSDPRIRLLENERNIGLTRSLNRGLKEARGEFVARLDADDISEPERLSRQVAFLNEHSEVALAGTWYTEIDEEGKWISQRKLPCSYTDIRWALLFYCPFVHSAVMFRRSLVLDRVGYYDESLSYSMDYEFWDRIANHLPVANLDEPLVRLRLHPRSMTSESRHSALEGHRLRIGNVARMLRWSEQGMDQDQFERHYRAIDALARGRSNSFYAENIAKTLDDLLLLSDLFCTYNKIEGADYYNHKLTLLSRVTHNLVAQARKKLKMGNIRNAAGLARLAFYLRVKARLMRTRFQFTTWR